MLPSIVELAEILHTRVLKPGDCVIDATVGRGRDTLWLAKRVGLAGKVIGFDNQIEAIEHTRELLTASDRHECVTLIHAGHETLLQQLVDLKIAPPIHSVIFNLGYLPNGDKTQITQAQTSISAMSQGLGLLAPGGLLTVAVYPGHPGGEEEAAAVLEWVETLDPRKFEIATYTPLKTARPAPWLLAVSRKG